MLAECAGGVSIGKFIIPYPHIRQVLVPKEGCRLILGTDGLWDFLAASRVFSLVGRMAPAAAAAALCKQAFIAQVRMASNALITFQKVQVFLTCGHYRLVSVLS